MRRWNRQQHLGTIRLLVSPSSLEHCLSNGYNAICMLRNRSYVNYHSPQKIQHSGRWWPCTYFAPRHLQLSSWWRHLGAAQEYPNLMAQMLLHYADVILSVMASQITSLTIVYSTIYSGAYQRKHQSSALLAFVRGIHQWPVNSPHKGPVTSKMFPFDDVIMVTMFYRHSCNMYDSWMSHIGS